jgi:acetyltransferase-like isoleucine patch superfamily enzyme|tara:strand:- start:43 stop:768 length:726 start_codon:yes stop_codon:yes gene_type:complete
MKWLITSIAQMLFTLFLYVVGITVIGLAIYPGVLLCVNIWQITIGYTLAVRIFFLCFSMAAAYFIYGICLLLILGVVRFVFRLSLKEGEYSMYSLGALKWALTNSLVLVLSNTFIDFILLTPFINIFYRFMGAKLGKNVQINSKFCADLSLLEIGDGAVIGGHATVIAHSFERGRIILRKVKIGKRALIGLNSVILPGTQIGNNAIIAAGAVLAKNTVVEPRSVYFGVPAMSTKERRENKG